MKEETPQDEAEGPAGAAAPEDEGPGVSAGLPPELAEELAARTARVEALEAEIAALQDRMKRMQAEFVNETKRIRHQTQVEGQFAIQRVVVDLVPLVDAFAGAAGALPDAPEAARLKEGLALLERQLDDVLVRHGVTRIEAAGRPFDPMQHEAVRLAERSDVAPQTVVEVVRPGFLLHGRVVRPAHVVVSQAPAALEPGASPQSGGR